MKKLSLLLFAIVLMNCSSDDEKTLNKNATTATYKIAYTSQLSDADLDLDITFIWNDENGDFQNETTTIIDPQAYSELANQKTVEITNRIGVKFKVNGGSNFLSDTYVKVTHIDSNTTYDVMNSESIALTGTTIDNNTLTVTFDADNHTFTSEYSTTN